MKKTFITFVAAVLSVICASAQSNIFNNPDNHAYAGVRVGLDIACPGDVESNGVSVDAYDNGAGFHVGGIYNFPVIANFYVEPGVSLYYNTYGVKASKDTSIRKFGFRIPVMAGYHFDFTDDIQAHVFTGPEFEIGCTAKAHYKSESENLYTDGGLKRFNCLWDFGVAVTYQKFWLGVTGGIGMCNMSDAKDVTFHENRVSITLGYNF